MVIIQGRSRQKQWSLWTKTNKIKVYEADDSGASKDQTSSAHRPHLPPCST